MKSKKEMDAKAKAMLNELDKPQHTPTPWTIKKDNSYFKVIGADNEVAFDDGSAGNEYEPACSETNAAFIVRAVNAHEELLKALKDEREWCLEMSEYGSVNATVQIGFANRAHILAQAIAKAEGR